MNRKQISIILVLCLIFASTFSLLGFSSEKGIHAEKGKGDEKVRDTVMMQPESLKRAEVDIMPYDVGTFMRYRYNEASYREDAEKDIKQKASKIAGIKKTPQEEAVATESEEFTYDGGTKYFLAYDGMYASYYFKEYTLRSVGTNIEIWVADDISYHDEEREDPVITQSQVDMMRDEFDENIYLKDTEFFGVPNSHTGEYSLLTEWGYFEEGYYEPEDGIERVIMLVDNVMDEQYYDSTYPFYIAGFYSPDYQDYFDRNVITIDTHKWAERLETVYYGVVAHEFQHLIHDDNDPYETTWINEGMSMFAEFLCGYGHADSHVEFFLQHPENSLVEWDDHYSAETGPETLADYGQTYLLTLYMYDKYGRDFIQNLAQDTDQGFASINKILTDYGTGIDFGELFRRFSVAVAIDSFMPGEGIYEFDSIDVQVDFESALDYDKDGVPAWGGDYKVLEDPAKIYNINFDGIDFLPVKWLCVENPIPVDSEPDLVFWGNQGNGIDNEIIFSADLSSVTAASINFDTYLDIEELWDAGFVQVSTDGGYTWTSLENEYTVDNTEFPLNTQAPEIFENLPGLTGYSGDWMNMSFDLTPWAGQEIFISFRYMTDMAYNDSGWFVDNIAIPEIDYMNDCSSLEGFVSLHELLGIHVDYAVTFVNKKALGIGNNEAFYDVLNIEPFNVTDDEAIRLKEFLGGGENYMIIWYAAPEGVMGAVDYTYEIMRKSEVKNK
ncbi:MAG: immune inhibitor A [Tissierellales bacterium]|nr:immune inhibitor A [Tissierellales bacterium]MBN2827348.1 immune inhibitor A [Tissierellales bacterium]